MRLLTLLLLLFPVAVAAQPAADTLDYSRIGEQMPDDLNCGDFVSQQDANRWYGRAQVYFGEIDQYQLDGDNDGQPCEGMTTAKREWFYPDSAVADTMTVNEGDQLWIEYELTPSRVACGGLPDETFRVDDFIALTRESVEGWNRDYLSYVDKADCLHLIGVLKDHQ